MPDPYERHSRSAWEWGPVPPRKQSRQAAAAEPEVKRPPAKKDRDLCKARHWKGVHTPVLRLREYSYRSHCQWRASWGYPPEPAWLCLHEEVCSGCGKILNVGVPTGECPDFRPITEAERAAIDEVIGRWTARRPVRTRVDGPQGYRKPKGDKA